MPSSQDKIRQLHFAIVGFY